MKLQNNVNSCFSFQHHMALNGYYASRNYFIHVCVRYTIEKVVLRRVENNIFDQIPVGVKLCDGLETLFDDLKSMGYLQRAVIPCDVACFALISHGSDQGPVQAIHSSGI